MNRDVDQLLTPSELATRWQVPLALLANWRSSGRGPRYTKIGHAVRYPLNEVKAYEAEHLAA